MNIKKTILPISIVVCLIGGSVIIVNGISKPSVKGVSTRISPTPTPTTISVPTSTLSPTLTDIPLSRDIRPTSIKQYGGWYWRPELNRAQVWIGTDSAGKDIWIDGIPTPTFTPTPEPKKSNQTSSGVSSAGNTIQTLQTKIIEKK